ncbi:hypothetical protein Bca4012_058162 [Brassica carinata]
MVFFHQSLPINRYCSALPRAYWTWERFLSLEDEKLQTARRMENDEEDLVVFFAAAPAHVPYHWNHHQVLTFLALEDENLQTTHRVEKDEEDPVVFATAPAPYHWNHHQVLRFLDLEDKKLQTTRRIEKDEEDLVIVFAAAYASVPYHAVFAAAPAHVPYHFVSEADYSYFLFLLY